MLACCGCLLSVRLCLATPTGHLRAPSALMLPVRLPLTTSQTLIPPIVRVGGNLQSKWLRPVVHGVVFWSCQMGSDSRMDLSCMLTSLKGWRGIRRRTHYEFPIALWDCAFCSRVALPKGQANIQRRCGVAGTMYYHSTMDPPLWV